MSPKTLSMTPALLRYIGEVGFREAPILTELRHETEQVIGRMAVMQISPDQGALMAMLVAATGARRLLEIGTFTGYSALACALALPEEGKMVCCDVSEEYTAIARRYWQRAGVADRIDLRIGPGVDTLDRLIGDGLTDSFDMAFIDADKPNYSNYYDRCLRLIRPGGLILIDNVLWNGSVADPSNQEEGTVAIRAFNTMLHADQRVTLALVPVGDGMTIARRL